MSASFTPSRLPRADAGTTEDGLSRRPVLPGGRGFVCHQPPTNDRAIRYLDLLGASIGLALLWPLLLVLALAVRMTTPGPAFFRATRTGRYGRPFTLYKFRSMSVDAPALGPAVTTAGDPRVTKVGRTLRRLKLDELPQLLNVLVGDMSLVGPRPEDPRYVGMYSRDQLEVLEARPGITSPASLRYREEEALLAGEEWDRRYIDRLMPRKLAIDGEYLRRRTVWSDIKVILSTVVSVLPVPFPGRDRATGKKELM